MADTDDNYGTKDDRIVREAKKRHAAAMEWESEFRARFTEDLRFANGDPDNRWQWPEEVYKLRVSPTSSQPCLTINKVRQHNLQIINDAKQNKPGVIIRPVSDDASYDAAQVYQGIVRHIEYISSAEQAYDTATSFQVQAGVGYWRVLTDYADADSFDQEIYIRRIPNPLNVVLDPDIAEVDGSDARFGFVWEDMPRDEYQARYGDDDEYGTDEGAIDGDHWSGKDHVRVAEYWRKRIVKDKLIMFTDERGDQTFARKSRMGPEVWSMVKAQPNAKVRDVEEPIIEWFRICGSTIKDRGEWAGIYIPIVRVIGEETIIDGKLDRKGHTRAMKDAQRMYNYYSSAATEHIALQTKTPYMASVEAIEGYEEYYARANTGNLAYLPHRAFDESGRPLPQPQKIPPPVMAPAFMSGLQITQNEMMMASGQYQAQMGQNENAKSGVAINARQRQGDNATYHFIDGLAVAIRFTGKILIDLIPKVYDTKRVIHIIADDGEKQQVQVDPTAKEPFQAGDKDRGESVAAIFNPNIGKYEVQSDIGPSYATKRQEAFNAMTQIISQNKELATVIGDLLFKNADFPGAQAIAERLQRMVPPQALGDKNDPQVMQLQGQLQQAQSVLQEMVKKLADKDRELDIKEADAESRRITAIGNSGPAIDQSQIQPLIEQIVRDALTTKFGSDEGAEQPLPQG